MRTIAIINQKGGCGKTTVSINLAATLAAQGRRTLLVDMDPQAHCALGLSVPSAQVEHGTAELLRHGLDGSLTLTDVAWQAAAGLDLVPSTMALAGVEPELRQAPDRDRRLVRVLAEAADRYDYCIIDCPPSIGLLTFNALRAADEVIVPVETGYFAMQGSIRQEQTIQMLARRVGHHVRLSVLPTMHDDQARLSRELLGEIHRQFGNRVLPTTIHLSSKLKEAASFGQPIGEYDPQCTSTADFAALSAWLETNAPHPCQQQPAQASGGWATHDQANHATQPMEAGGDLPHATMLDEPQPEPVAVAEAPTRVNGQSRSPGAPTRKPTPPKPALSRAAELVERARALSARSAHIADQFGTGARSTPQPVSTHVEPTPQPQAGTEQAVAEAVVDSQVPQSHHRFARLFGARSTSRGVLFVQPAAEASHTRQASQVSVVGDFNQWTPTDTPLENNRELGLWQTCIQLPPGRYRYRLAIDGQWQPDPYNPTTEIDSEGRSHNVLEITA